jgi:hypothetical protein
VRPFDIAPFALPGTPPGELCFEEARDITTVQATFSRVAPARVGIEYLQRTWPRVRLEEQRDRENPSAFGWIPVDDQWNGTWRRASTTTSVNGKQALLSFNPLGKERLADAPRGYDVRFRRTLGLRIVCPDPESIRGVQVYTASLPAQTRLRVSLDAGRRTPGKSITVTAYNARILGIDAAEGVRAAGTQITLGSTRARGFAISVSHMVPSHPWCGDDSLVTFALQADSFTIRIQDLFTQGPIWHAELGVFITPPDSGEGFADYRESIRGKQTTLGRVKAAEEQSFGRAFHGQPRGQPVNFSLGCARSPQRFWLEANGDLVLERRNLDFFGRRPELAAAMRTKGNARFFFGLERWVNCGRFAEPGAVPVYNIHAKKACLFLEQVVLCVPILRSIMGGPLTWEEPTAALMRFRITNRGDADVRAELAIAYSLDSHRSRTSLQVGEPADAYRIPIGPRDAVQIAGNQVTTEHEGKQVTRAVFATSSMIVSGSCAGWEATLAPGTSCEVLLKIPFLPPADAAAEAALEKLEFDLCRKEVTAWWLAEARRGSQLSTPVPHLDAVHVAHLSHVEFSDIAMPGNPALVNTSVGSSTYGNFQNEACMIIQELDQRGLAEEVESRLQVYVDFAGTARQPGNFTDFEGSFYGAGGWESGDYNQHHGWVLWYLSEHFLLTGNRTWFDRVVPAVIAGAEWVFRQRKTTLGDPPHSRGWERGFLPAGSLEDVTEFHYWLSTNCLTWRGTDAAARALETAGHPEAPRIRAESDAFRRDLLRGFTLGRQHAPLVPLRDGRWVPHFPSRLYARGRDVGWIREVLEGAVYLLISGLLQSGSREARWILDDYQDNLYHTPPYGFVMRDPELNLVNRGGFSIQPNLLAGLMPHLERDEPEVYLWMFFNAWVSCYREEVDGMIEHPMPELGFHNPTAFKTSDEANAVMWLRAMLVYSTPRLLHLGRAMPRAWLGSGEETRITGVRTHYGEVSARWLSAGLPQGRLLLEAEVGPGADAPRFLARFRHPAGAALAAVTVNGEPCNKFDPQRGDVDITGLRGKIRIEASFTGATG